MQFIGQSTAMVGGEVRITLQFEFIAGRDVEKTIDTGELLPATHVRDFMRGVLRGASALHSGGVIHRDLKPANIALRADDWASPVILDLGLAKILDLSSVTNYPALVGTAPYMAPEQLGGDRVRKAADVFAIGVVVFEAVTGMHPFYVPGSTVTVNDLVDAIHAGPKVGLLSVLDDSCRSAVLRMLSAEEHRRGSTKSLLQLLEDQ